MPEAEDVPSALATETPPLAPRSDQPEEIEMAPPVGPVAAVAFPPKILTRPPVLVVGDALVATPPTILSAPPAVPEPLEMNTCPPVE